MSTATFAEFAERADYSLLEALTPDPKATADGEDHRPRQVLSGHYVPVTPTPIPEPQYLAHSRSLFSELGLSDDLAQDDQFRRMFSGDLGVATGPMRPWGWATGYALSIYGTEYTQQCPFGNGNGYGDGRAMSVFEGLFEGRRWEMQLKGGGPTPYCRGADGRAVLRSSVREFLAQEFMHALGVPTSRSLHQMAVATKMAVSPIRLVISSSCRLSERSFLALPTVVLGCFPRCKASARHWPSVKTPGRSSGDDGFSVRVR